MAHRCIGTGNLFLYGPSVHRHRKFLPNKSSRFTFVIAQGWEGCVLYDPSVHRPTRQGSSGHRLLATERSCGKAKDDRPIGHTGETHLLFKATHP